MLYSPYAIMDVFAIGEVVVGSEKNITEKYATKARIYYCEIVPCDIVHVEVLFTGVVYQLTEHFKKVLPNYL